MKKLRDNALIVNNVEYVLVKVAGMPHSFVQIANAPGMTEQWPVEEWTDEDGQGYPAHSISRYYISSSSCVLFKHGNFDLYMRMWEDLLYS